MQTVLPFYIARAAREYLLSYLPWATTTHKVETNPQKVNPIEVYWKFFENYDAVIDVHSLRGLSDGWIIAHNSEKVLNTLYGRFVAFVGPYKTGKTHLMHILFDIDLAEHQTMHTYGLSFKLVNCVEKVTTNYPAKYLEKYQKQNQVILSADLILIDTPGTHSPTNSQDHDDVRGTEDFLRSSALKLADQIVFVTSSFDRACQYQIAALISQLRNRSHTPTNDSPLIIVHNNALIHTETILEELIDIVASTYSNWNIDYRYEGACVFRSGITQHWFIVNNNCEWGKLHNSMTIPYLRKYLLDHTIPSCKNISDTLKAQFKELRKYFKEFDSNNVEIFLPEVGSEQYPEIRLKQSKQLELRRLVYNDTGVQQEAEYCELIQTEG